MSASPPSLSFLPRPEQPGVVYMDAQMSKLLTKQEEIIAGQRRTGVEIAELRAMLATLTTAVAETRDAVASLKGQIVPPLHNALHDAAETTLASIAHYSGDKIVGKAVHDIVPTLSNTLASVVTTTLENQLAASQVLQDVELALKTASLGGGNARRSVGGRTSVTRVRVSQTSDDGRAKNAGPELWDRARWIEWLGSNVSLFKSIDEQEVADVFDSSVECYKVDAGTSVVDQGEEGSSMYVLVQGELDVTIDDPKVNQGRTLKVEVLRSGQFFGEMVRKEK